jgi:hypothetical protein
MGSDYLKIIRDQIVFIAALFSIFGVIYADFYYSSFGVRYQSLNLSPTHILYRGVTLIYFNLYFLLVFLMIIIGVLMSRLGFSILVGGYAMRGGIVIYLILSIAAVIGAYLSVTTGQNTAVQDMYVNTTSLREITCFHSKNEEKAQFVTQMLESGPVLLLNSSGEHILIFHPPKHRLTQPSIEVQNVWISSDDFYTDRAPTEDVPAKCRVPP